MDELYILCCKKVAKERVQYIVMKIILLIFDCVAATQMQHTYFYKVRTFFKNLLPVVQ